MHTRQLSIGNALWRNDQVKSQLLDNVCCLQAQPGN
jgi:hypothetical protein